MAEKQKKKQWFSKETNRLYQLYGDPPTLKISGVPMHRHIKMTPLEDTETKINALKPYGIVLDTCTGLGYTAIYSARLEEVKKVITVEKDKNVIEIARMNSYSKELFENKKIEIVNANVFEKIKEFDDNYFDCIVHDPPTFNLASELYSGAFYKELFRVLKKNCSLWHYCPEPGKAGKQGSNLKEKVIKNLGSVGFKNIIHNNKSAGILARK